MAKKEKIAVETQEVEIVKPDTENTESEDAPNGENN